MWEEIRFRLMVAVFAFFAGAIAIAIFQASFADRVTASGVLWGALVIAVICAIFPRVLGVIASLMS